MIITVNGAEQDVADDVTVAEVVTLVHPDAAQHRGVAVAVDRVVVPRTQWPTTKIAAGAHVEFVTAVQGG